VNVRFLVLKLAAAAALAAAASMCVVSLGYALFALVKPPLGPSGAAAVVALAAALIALLAALTLHGKSPLRTEPKHAAAGLTGRLFDTAMERPLAVAALVAAAGWILFRNPSLVSMAAARFLERPRRRR
jgi:hypothetical protein